MNETYLKSKFEVGDSVWVANVDNPKQVDINQIWIKGKLFKDNSQEYMQELTVNYGFRQPMGGYYSDRTVFETEQECREYIIKRNLESANRSFDMAVHELDEAVKNYQRAKEDLRKASEKESNNN